MSFGVTFAISSSIWELFDCTFCIKKSIGAPKLPQEAPRSKMQLSPHPYGHQFWHLFDTFSRHAPLFSMSFRGDVLVMLSWCICVPFLTIFPPITCAMWSVPEVIWTARAWPKDMFWLLSAPRNYKKTKQKSIAIWSFIFSGFWHHFGYMFWRRSDFLEQMVVYKIVCEKGAPKRWNK